MKKITTFVCTAFAALIMASCSSNSPKGVVQKYISCFIDKDFEGAVDCMDLSNMDLTPEKEKEYKKEIVSLIETKYPKVIENQGKIKSIEVLSEEVAEDGNSAIVTFKVTSEKDGESKESTEKLKVHKDKNGNWKMEL